VPGVKEAIEMVFSKLKTLMRKAKVRKVEDLWRKLGELCDVFTPQECLNDFKHAGYGKKGLLQTSF
jgi:transposase